MGKDLIGVRLIYSHCWSSRHYSSSCVLREVNISLCHWRPIHRINARLPGMAPKFCWGHTRGMTGMYWLCVDNKFERSLHIPYMAASVPSIMRMNNRHFWSQHGSGRYSLCWGKQTSATFFFWICRSLFLHIADNNFVSFAIMLAELISEIKLITFSCSGVFLSMIPY